VHTEVVAAQAATLREWADQWGRVDLPGALDLQKRLIGAAEVAQAIAAGTPLPEAISLLPEMPQQDTLRDG